MLYNNQDFNMDQTASIVGDGNIIDQDMDIDLNINGMGMNNQGTYMQGTTQSPIIEPMQERQINRTIIHQVPHVCPIRTRIINHHIYKHTYCPEYSCCEENVVSNINQGSCCNFR